MGEENSKKTSESGVKGPGRRETGVRTEKQAGSGHAGPSRPREELGFYSKCHVT